MTPPAGTVTPSEPTGQGDKLGFEAPLRPHKADGSIGREPVQLDLLGWAAAQALSAAPAVPGLPPEPLALQADPQPLRLTRVDPSCNMRRFYSVALARSLFGEVGVVRRWGRIGSQGQSRTDWHEGAEPARSARQKLLTRKRRRGYRPNHCQLA